MENERLWSGNYIRVFLSNLLLMCTNNMVASVFVVFLKSKGGTDFDAGLAAYLYSFACLLIRPVAGWILDKKERRLMTLVCLTGMALTDYFYVILPVLVFLIVNRALSGIFCGSASTALTTNAYDTLPKRFFNKGVGYFGLSNATATAIGPAIGLALFDRGGALLLFGAMGTMMLAALLLMRSFRFLPAPARTRERFTLKDVTSLLEKRSVPASLLMSFCAFGSGMMTTYMVPFFAERGIGSTGLYFAFQASGTFISRVFLGRLGGKGGEGPLVYMSAGLFMCGIVLIVFSPAVWTVCLGGFMMGIGYGFTVTGLQIMSVRIVPPERRGASAATYSCAWDIAAAFGGLIGGILVTYMRYSAAFTCLLLIYPVYFLLYLLVFRHHPSAYKVWLKTQEKE